MKGFFSGVLSIFIALFVVSVPSASRAADMFLPFTDAWLYNDNGLDQGTVWRNAPLDYYFEWQFGLTEMGFGDGDEFTELNAAPGGVPLNTAYFVTTFNVSSAAAYSNITLRLRRDDGAIVYLNGVEVFRSNMPTGAVNYGTSALRNIEGAEESLFAQRVLPASALLSGENLVAVEVHQAAGGSSDLSFALVVIGHRINENQPPSAFPGFVTTEQNKSTNITLNAIDPNGSPLSYTIVSSPLHGSLSGVLPNVTYIPNAGYVGPDLFSFSANDGQWNTEVADVSIDVKLPSNHPPVANAQAVSTAEDNALTITLGASDEDGDTLAYSNTSTAHGSLTVGEGLTLLYQPDPNYFGPDSFTFTVDDGNGGVATATINITVTPVNDAPFPDAQSLATDEDMSLPVFLTASDVEGDALSFSYGQPSFGVITGSGRQLTYQPSANFNGADSFIFSVNDGNGGVASAIVHISVAALNDNPTADNQNVSVAEDNTAGILVSAGDVDGDALSYSYTHPAHGSISGSGRTAIYQPAANYSGPDSFTFTVDDGNGGTATATVSITVTPVNDPPVALASAASASDPTNFTRNLTVLANNNQGANILLNSTGSSDIDGNGFTYAWYQGSNTSPFSTAANPTVSLPAGSYSLTLVVSDGASTASDSITVEIFTMGSLVQAFASQVEAANLKPSERNGLLGHLNAALSAFNSGNVRAGVHQLELFQERVNKKVAPGNPSLASALNAGAQRIIREVSGQ